MKHIFRILGLVLIIILAQSCKKEIDNTLRDLDGNVYTSVTICNQVWMKENLKTTTYNDGVAIPLVDDKTGWYLLTTPAYCWYLEDEAGYKVTYGALYNWYTLDPASNGHKNVCPNGWHVPTDSEWAELFTCLGGDSVAGGKLKEIGNTHWESPNIGATNESGFTALPGGMITTEPATPSSQFARFRDINWASRWWSTTESPYTPLAWGVSAHFNYNIAFHEFTWKEDGRSVRCLKNY